MIESFIVATLVGVVEVGPGICQMDLLNHDNTIHTSTFPVRPSSPTTNQSMKAEINTLP